MKTRLMAGAFLTCHGKVLLLHRSEKKKIAPGLWSCVGGHLEPEELNAPMTACYREIEEETGIPPSDILNLRLKYITVRKTEDEIRTVFYFTGELKSEVPLPLCGKSAMRGRRAALGQPCGYAFKTDELFRQADYQPLRGKPTRRARMALRRQSGQHGNDVDSPLLTRFCQRSAKKERPSLWGGDILNNLSYNTIPGI